MQHKKYRIFLSVLLFTCLFLAGCQSGEKVDLNQAQTQKAFEQFTETLFQTEVQSDAITINYTLEHPENYNIKDTNPDFGNFSLDSMKQSLACSENYYNRLHSFSYKQLTPNQKLTYDILDYAYQPDKDEMDYMLYQECLSPTIGIQAQLPVLLAEYNFRSQKDIDTYLLLLTDMPDYFKQIGTFEQEKSKAGLFMSDFAAQDIINQCKSFIKVPKKNLLITIFNNKIKNFAGISKEDQNAYIKTNQNAVLNFVIPAYEHLISVLESLKGTGRNDKGLSYFPKGKEYYELLAKAETGSGKNMKEMEKALTESIEKNMKKIKEISTSNPAAFLQFSNPDYGRTKPDDILDFLKENITNDFPELEEVSYTVNYVDSSLQDYLSPAFYLTPPLDNCTKNSIYINPSKKFESSELFPTLAHEGYPGHLFQCVYFNMTNPPPIRSLLNFGGYSEGWATYVEEQSYALAGLDKDTVELLKANKAGTLSLYGKLDICIHYNGWSLEKTAAYLKDILGITNKDLITEIYHAIIEEPGNYLKYSLGSLEFWELREKAEKNLGKEFSLKEFHDFILTTGPAPFPIIEDQLDKWLKSQPK